MLKMDKETMEPEVNEGMNQQEHLKEQSADSPSKEERRAERQRKYVIAVIVCSLISVLILGGVGVGASVVGNKITKSRVEDKGVKDGNAHGLIVAEKSYYEQGVMDGHLDGMLAYKDDLFTKEQEEKRRAEEQKKEEERLAEEIRLAEVKALSDEKIRGYEEEFERNFIKDIEKFEDKAVITTRYKALQDLKLLINSEIDVGYPTVTDSMEMVTKIDETMSSYALRLEVIEEKEKKDAEEKARKDAEEKAKQEAEAKRKAEEEKKKKEKETIEAEQIDPQKVKYLGNFKLTAYCKCEECSGQWSNSPTASGTTPVEGKTVAMYGVPFGTKLLINDVVYTVEDRGTPYGHVDIYFENHADTGKFGVKYADVYQIDS